MLIRVAHSPDSDDAFMFYALANDKIETGEYCFEHTLSDIETLNQKALTGSYEVSAISFHAFPKVADRYMLLSSGSSMGDGYGPMLVAKNEIDLKDISKKTIAIPGLMTTAYLALQIFEPNLNIKVIPFNKILDALAADEVDIGLIIHEGQLTYATEGFHQLLDLGQWWQEKTDGLPLPLGGNVIRRNLGMEHCQKISKIIREGIIYSLEHRKAALDYALQFARGMDPNLADKFVGMYVNELTVDYGERGQKALHRLYDEAIAKGLLKGKPPLEFI
ncbi:MAG: ABC transporter substrate-binding protein [Deltaproteobacteria bacterium]|nr:ABC transporter substrate-binding protein [Deltaproteobacteria bacterium]